jgi:hypothetical protein
MYLIVSSFRSQPRRQSTATTQIIASPCAPAKAARILVGSLARTVTRLRETRVSAPHPRYSAMASAGLPTRAPRAKPLPKGAGSAAAHAQKWGTVGRPVVCSEGVHVHGSASTPHATWKAVSVPGPAVARNLTLTFINFRWWMRAPPDALLAYRPGLHCPPRCRRRLLSVRRVCCPSLHVWIRPITRRHTLCLCTGSHLQAPCLHTRG